MTVNPTQQRLQLGHAARHAGRSDEALEHYRSALEHDPSSVEANTVLGLMLLRTGQAIEAEAPLRKALESAPRHPAARMNFALWLAQADRLEEAVDVVAGVAQDEPNRHWAWERLGELKARLRRFGEAATHFERASQLQQQDPSLLFKVARAHFDAGRREEASRFLGQAAALAPKNPAILGLYAELHEAASDWAALGQAATAWSQAAPEDPAPWRALAKAEWQIGYPRRAMQTFRRAFECGAKGAEAHATFGRLCLQALDTDAAMTAFDEAERLDAQNAAALSGKAVLLMWKGEYDAARTYARRALAANPHDVGAYKTLAQLGEGRLEAADLAALRQIAADPRIYAVDRITGYYAVGDALDHEQRIDDAFAAYESASRLMDEQADVEGLRYDRAARVMQVDELIATFAEAPEPASAGAAELPAPVFIVGMPRSGTTLIESVLAAHSRVAAGGELPGMRWVMTEFLAREPATPVEALEDAVLAKWRAQVRELLPAPSGALVATDKNPWNFDAIGLIPRLFPNARIIHVRRNPVETSLSIYRNEFTKFVRFAHGLGDIGHFYGEYARLMAHWERIAGDRLVTIQYEDFITQFDSAARELVAAAGLAWEPACGEFWKSPRVVSTISTMQVRRPPTRVSTRAEAYKAYLAPLVAALRETGVDLETGAWRDRA